MSERLSFLLQHHQSPRPSVTLTGATCNTELSAICAHSGAAGTSGSTLGTDPAPHC